MPYIPHTEDDIKSMLDAIGAESIDELFDEIPDSLRIKGLPGIPTGITEMEIGNIMTMRATQDAGASCFIGAGAYDHHIPAAVWEITTRGEYYSAYTPYQAEASQGTLQLIYEYQSMMCALTGMDVSNASLYDGASALAEAVLMAVRSHRKSKSRRILMPKTVHPAYRATVHSLVSRQNIELVDIDYDTEHGTITLDALRNLDGEDVTALVIPQPNFFGVLEDVDALTRWAHENGALVIGVVNPLSLSLLKAPGDWGGKGADIVCGEGQSLGAPLSSGGPYYGLMCCKQALVRQMPGRIVGRTLDSQGREGFVLTLQAREQHIRRSKATSNICTNQGLVVTASTIHMSIMGAQGLELAAAKSHEQTTKLLTNLSGIDGVKAVFESNVFNEAVIQLDMKVSDVLGALAERDVLGGYDLSADYPELGNALLVCATEKRSDAEIEHYREALTSILANNNVPEAVEC